MTPNVFDGHALDLPRFARRQHRSAVEIIHAHEKNVTEPFSGRLSAAATGHLDQHPDGFLGRSGPRVFFVR